MYFEQSDVVHCVVVCTRVLFARTSILIHGALAIIFVDPFM